MSALMCCCGICCQEVGTACIRLLGPRRAAQIFYMLMIVLFIIPVVVVTFILDKVQLLKSITPTQLLKSFSSIVLRMSLCLFVLFFLLLLFMLCRSKLSQVINEGLFCTKYMLLIAFFVGSLFLPQSILDIYASVAKISSILYLVVQAIILIDIFYLMGINLVKRYDQGQTFCAGFLIGSTIFVEAMAIFVTVFAFIKFGGDQCGSTTWVSIITTVLIVVLPLVQLLGFNPQNSLLTTALVTLTIAYLTFAAQEYFKDGCLVRLTPLGYGLEVSISLILFALTTYGTLMGGFSENQYQDGPPENMLKKETVQSKQADQNSVQWSNAREYTDNWGWIRWHFYMCLGVMYLGMLFTNWQSTDRIAQNLKGSDFVFWLKLISSWVMALFYIWTLLAPRIFPDRDFTVR